MVMIETRPLNLGADAVSKDFIKRYQKLLGRLDPGEQIYAGDLLAARIARSSGNQSAWEKFTRNNNSKTMAQSLRKKPEGKDIMALIQRAFPIETGDPQINTSAFVVHGEVKRDEVNNPEGVLTK